MRWTQQKAADFFGVSRSRWSELEAGANPSGSLGKHMASVVGHAVRDLSKKTPLPPAKARRR